MHIIISINNIYIYIYIYIYRERERERENLRSEPARLLGTTQTGSYQKGRFIPPKPKRLHF